MYKIRLIFIFFILFTVFNDSWGMNGLGDWRWRNDDGSETKATWRTGIDTMSVLSNNVDPIRIRMVIDYWDSVHMDSIFLYYKGKTKDSVKISDDASNDFVLSRSIYFKNGEATTYQLNDSSTFAGGFMVDSSLVSTFTCPKKSQIYSAEIEFCIKPTASVLPNYKYRFFPVNSDGVLNISDTILLKSAKFNPVIIWNNSAQANKGDTIGGKKFFATATYGDSTLLGKMTYYPIAGTVLEPGNGQAVTAYFAPADTAVFKADSVKTTISVKTSVNIAVASVPNVYPNPTHGLITINANEGNVIVSDLEGKIVLESDLTVSDEIDLSGIAPGLYILQLKNNEGVFCYKIIKQ
jgi:hypothetical protein